MKTRRDRRMEKKDERTSQCDTRVKVDEEASRGGY